MYKSIVACDYRVPHQAHTYKATIPHELTKTGHDYFWLLPMGVDHVIRLLL